jgi:hypothetical protein
MARSQSSTAAGRAQLGMKNIGDFKGFSLNCKFAAAQLEGRDLRQGHSEKRYAERIEC